MHTAKPEPSIAATLLIVCRQVMPGQLVCLIDQGIKYPSSIVSFTLTVGIFPAVPHTT